MRRCPSCDEVPVASRAPSKFWASTVGSVEPPTWGSTATTGWSTRTSTTVGVTRMIPSVSVPLSRDR